jgi:hypothetical protein
MKACRAKDINRTFMELKRLPQSITTLWNVHTENIGVDINRTFMELKPFCV